MIGAFYKALRAQKLYVVQYTDGREILRDLPTPQQRLIMEAEGHPFRIVTFYSEFALPIEVAVSLRGLT